MYSAYKLNKQGDNIQPWHTPFLILNQSVVPCLVPTVASWPAYGFQRRQVKGVWYSHLFSVVNETEVNGFLEYSHFFNDPTDIGHLISDSSAFSKLSLNIWKFTVHVLLKPGLENSEHYFTSVWDEGNCVVWAFFGIAFFLGLEWKLSLFQSCGHCWVFQICWHIECIPLTALSFRIWNSSTGIPSPPLALFVVMLSKAHLTSLSKMSGSRLVITSSWLSGLWRSFFV